MSEIDFPLDDGPERQLDWTSAQQNAASDPKASAWVSANAGSGKTHVLTQRVIRLMLAGCRPSAILCLTYTKAAASEMSNRVFKRLSEWATMDDGTLAEEIGRLEGRMPDRIRLVEARRLFARALETPGGLKIQTIHAFCEALLHQFPLEANVAGHFEVLDDSGSAELLAEARRRLLSDSHAGQDPALARAFALVLDLAEETGLDRLIGDIIARRTGIRAFLDASHRHGGASRLLEAMLGVPENAERTVLEAGFWPLPGFDPAMQTDYFELVRRHGTKTAQAIADQLALAALEPAAGKQKDLVRAALFTQEGKPRALKTIVPKAMEHADPNLIDRFGRAQGVLAEKLDQLAALALTEATGAALILARKLESDYHQMKLHRGLLDFEDLIERTADLLDKPGIGAWVHYKLDQGIDHILVDEAQDTSPTQWRIIKALSSDFFAGEGSRSSLRTFFAVGDEKQSIYSFQGARPEKFDAERRATDRLASGSGQIFRSIRLPLSFRSTDDVLSAVDQVFSMPDHLRGLNAAAEKPVHKSSRTGQAGRVDIWDTIAPEPKAEEDEDWTAPFDRLSEQSPANQLALRIAATIGAMIGRQPIATENGSRPVQAGDILVLVRKRDNFVGALTRALKRSGSIPVAGADRLVLASHIAILDLTALARFLLEPGDDLSLASLFKSPLLGLTEDDLAAVAAHRPDDLSLWESMKAAATAKPDLAEAVRRLESWRDLSRRMRVHDLFSRILGAGGGRRAYLARLGQEVSDILDEFLGFALNHETTALPGLQSFVESLETEAPTIKREQDKGRNEVRIMTVHAAKGLEAPVVFLVDGSSAVQVSQSIPKIRMIAHAGLDIPVWLPGKSMACKATEADDQRLKAEAEAEYRRLFYVGMTRAADHLVICAYQGQREPGMTWATMARNALSADPVRCRPVSWSIGSQSWHGLRWQTGTDPEEAGGTSEPASSRKPAAAPARLFEPLPPDPALPRPLNPSGAHALIDETDGDLVVGSPLFSNQPGIDRSASRGRTIHRLLELLPGEPEHKHRELAERYVARALPDWPVHDRAEIVDQVLGVLANPEMKTLFGLHGQAEVSIMGTISLGGRDHALSGRIDRLAVEADSVHIADFKTNRVPPRMPQDIPVAHVAQLALYRAVLAPLYPAHEIRAVLIYTAGPVIHPLTSRQLDAALVAISAE